MSVTQTARQLAGPWGDADAAAMELDDWGPLADPVGTPLDGPMGTRGKEFYTSPDGKISCGIWEVDAGRFRSVFDGDGETIHVVKGRMTCIAEDGTTTHYGPGDTATFAPGWRGEWHILEPMRKFYAAFKLAPGA